MIIKDGYVLFQPSSKYPNEFVRNELPISAMTLAARSKRTADHVITGEIMISDYR